MKKTDQQWRKDNGVPETARYADTYYLMSYISIINGQLRPHRLKVRCKQRRGHGTGSYIWVEKS